MLLIVVVGAYSPVTGNHAYQLHGSTPRGNVGPRNRVVAHRAVLLLAVAGTGAGESSPVSGNAPSTLGGDAPPDEGPPAALGKGSAGDVASGKGAASVSSSLLARSRI